MEPQEAPQLDPLRRFLRRRRFIVSTRFQFSLLMIGVLQTALVLAVVGVALLGPLLVTVAFADPDSSEHVKASQQLLGFDARFWPAVGFAFLLCGLISIRTSHRIAGPLVAFGRAFRSIAAGEVPPRIRLRRGDYLNDEADAVNDVIVRLEFQENEMAELRRALQIARRQVQAHGSGDTQDVSGILEETEHSLGPILSQGDKE